MKTKTTIEVINKELALEKLSIRKYYSRNRFTGANYRVVLRENENVGHYRTLVDAIEAARQTVKERNP